MDKKKLNEKVKRNRKQFQLQSVLGVHSFYVERNYQTSSSFAMIE